MLCMVCHGLSSGDVVERNGQVIVNLWQGGLTSLAQVYWRLRWQDDRK